jgi:outer membrane receptor protein involved in Fe transport
MKYLIVLFIIFSAYSANYESMSLDVLNSQQVATGSFVASNFEEYPGSITVITREQIESSGARNLSELLEIYVPGFQYMYSKWNGVLWGMRGLSSDMNDKVLVLINGKMVTDRGVGGFVSETELGFLRLFDRIEVSRGPSNSIYGSGSTAGVVNLIIDRYKEYRSDVTVNVPPQSFYRLFNGEQGSVSKNIEATTTHKLGKDTDLLVSYSYRDNPGLGSNQTRIFGNYEIMPHGGSDRLMPYSGIPSAGSFGRTNGNKAATVYATGKPFTVFFRMTQQSVELSPFFLPDPWYGLPGDTAYIGDRRFIRNGGGEDGNYMLWSNRTQRINNSYTAYADYEKEIFGGDLKVSVSLMGSQNIAQQPADPNYRTGSYALITESGEERTQAGATYVKGIGSSSTLAVGIEHRVDHIGPSPSGKNISGDATTGWVPDSRLKHLPEATYNNTGFFVEAEKEIKKFSFLGGFRVDKHTRSDITLSPKGMLSYKLSHDHSFKLIAQTSTNTPNALAYEARRDIDGNIPSESFQYREPQDTNSAVIFAVSQEDRSRLRPERSSSLEIASIHNLGGWTFLTSNSLNKFEDILSWYVPEQRTKNLTNYTSFVSEVELFKRFSNGVKIGSSASLQMIVGRETRPLKHISEKMVPVLQTPLEVISGEIPETAIDSFYQENPKVYTPTPYSEIYPDKPVVYDTLELDNPVHSTVSADGFGFNNLHTVVSKGYLDMPFYKRKLNFHTDLRVFWGLTARQTIIDNLNVPENRFKGIQESPMLKWNASLRYRFDNGMYVGLYGYNLLGEEDNIHSLRWQQMVDDSQMGLFSVDQRTWSLEVGKRF